MSQLSRFLFDCRKICIHVIDVLPVWGPNIDKGHKKIYALISVQQDTPVSATNSTTKNFQKNRHPNNFLPSSVLEKCGKAYKACWSKGLVQWRLVHRSEEKKTVFESWGRRRVTFAARGRKWLKCVRIRAWELDSRDQSKKSYENMLKLTKGLC